VATSRRRERELARRRYERRRQAELERRARNKRRNTIAGAVTGTAIVIAVLLILTFTVFTGGGKKASVKAGATPSTSASPTPAAPKTCASIKPNPPAKGDPRIPPVTGTLTDKLVSKDIKVGHGRAAKSGDKVTVKYVGVSCDTGTAFDASYTDGAKNQEFSVTLGQGQVIPGWDQGIVGMKAGGVRELVIPASLAYGAQGQGPIKPNDTLVFLITMVKV
jgi:FKBP-type peptidyl-prolyl cis-trans isomerase